MNRNLLLIAVAAIAVVGVAVGILLLGSGPSQGSLSGAIGPIPTTLTLNISACTEPDGRSEPGALNFTLSGSLLDDNGGPVPGRTILFARSGATTGQASFMEGPGQSGSAVTAADGSFRLDKQELPTRDYSAGAYQEFHASFAGDAEYLSSSSNTVRKLC